MSPSSGTAGTSAAVSELVSVVIPVYNTGRYIGEAVRSALEQTYSPMEVIVVDDGSTDGTPGVVRGFGPRVTLLQQANQGVCTARNAGIQAARGPYVAFLDADDSWRPTKIEQQVAVFRRHPEVGVVTTRCQHVDAEGRPQLTEFKHASSRRCDRVVELYDELLMRGNMLAISSAAMRKGLLEKVGGFSKEGRMMSADYDLWLRVAGSTRFYILSEPLTSYRVLESSMIHGSLEKEYGSQLEILERHRHRYTDRTYRKRLANIYYDWADSAFWRGEPEAWRRLGQSLAHDPFSPATWLLGARATARLLLERVGVLKRSKEGRS
jgi:glycosyltransferase involved in cell wall biosynthesis